MFMNRTGNLQNIHLVKIIGSAWIIFDQLKRLIVSLEILHVHLSR